MINLYPILVSYKDEKYLDFQSALIPNVNKSTFIGVRTPVLKNIAISLNKQDALEFISNLPHHYFDENQVHAFIISNEKNFEESITHLENFLPFIDNWATCDQTSPISFKNNKEKLLPYIKKWLKSSHVYTKRFAIITLMRHYLGVDFKPLYVEMVLNSIETPSDYYVDMAVAWFMQNALLKQWDYSINIIKNKILPKWIHNKSIQKSIESLRLSNKQKEILKSLKI